MHLNEDVDNPFKMDKKEHKPVCLIVLGMAGSGKTSLVSRLSTTPQQPYIVNLDPACINLPYFSHIGIRNAALI